MDAHSSGSGEGVGADALIGQLVANYRVVGWIGQGGMGAVYLAQHTVLGRSAAVKVLLPEFSHNRELVGRFLNEARATARLRHRGFAEIFDSGTLRDGSAYLVMEYLRGSNLGAAMAWRGTLSVGETLAVLRAVAASVAHAHAHGIVHRDLKPDNIFLALDGEAGPGPAGVVVKVLDFGIAKLVGPSNANAAHTRTGSLLGTPIYMSPEQCRGAGYVDHRTDIYSLGCIAYHALTGRPPFEFEGFGEIIAAHLNQPPAPPRTLVPTLSLPVETFLLQLLEKDPGRRPQTMEAVVVAMEELQQAEAGRAPDLMTLIPPEALAQSDSLMKTATPPPAPPGATPPGRPGATTPLPDAGYLRTPHPGSNPEIGGTRRLAGTRVAGQGTISTLSGAASETGDLRAALGLSPRRRAPRIAMVVGGVLALCIGLVVVLGGLGSHPPSPARTNRADESAVSAAPLPSPRSVETDPAPAPLPPAAPSREERPSTQFADAKVAVRIGSVPAGARVVDAQTGRTLGETPFDVLLPRGSGERGFIVRKPGFRPKRINLDAGRNSEANVTLDRRADGKPGGSDDGDDDRRKL